MNQRLLIACCSPIDLPGWRWISGQLDSDRYDWRFFSTAPRNACERMIRRPDVARLRGCRELTRCVIREAPNLIVTHGPLTTCWSELFARRRRFGAQSDRARIPHLAFTFNFSQLPRGVRRRIMRRAFSTVDRFVVFSNFERTLYSEYFDISSERIDMVHWGVREPPADPGAVPLVAGEYCCAVGSQARDYAGLLDALRRLPKLRLVLVASPENLRGLSIPDNVSVRLNIPLSDVHNIVRHSRFVVLPLLHSEVPCGHVTMVTAMFLGKAVVATESAGISDYVEHGQTGLCAPPGDPAALADTIRKLWEDAALCERLGAAGRKFALAHCTERTTVDYVQRLLDKFESTGGI